MSRQNQCLVPSGGYNTNSRSFVTLFCCWPPFTTRCRDLHCTSRWSLPPDANMRVNPLIGFELAALRWMPWQRFRAFSWRRVSRWYCLCTNHHSVTRPPPWMSLNNGMWCSAVVRSRAFPKKFTHKNHKSERRLIAFVEISSSCVWGTDLSQFNSRLFRSSAKSSLSVKNRFN